MYSPVSTTRKCDFFIYSEEVLRVRAESVVLICADYDFEPLSAGYEISPAASSWGRKGVSSRKTSTQIDVDAGPRRTIRRSPDIGKQMCSHRIAYNSANSIAEPALLRHSNRLHQRFKKKSRQNTRLNRIPKEVAIGIKLANRLGGRFGYSGSNLLSEGLPGNLE
jgi:hypothetical protein